MNNEKQDLLYVVIGDAEGNEDPNRILGPEPGF
jgi:hypothetical protein